MEQPQGKLTFTMNPTHPLDRSKQSTTEDHNPRSQSSKLIGTVSSLFCATHLLQRACRHKCENQDDEFSPLDSFSTRDTTDASTIHSAAFDAPLQPPFCLTEVTGMTTATADPVLPRDATRELQVVLKTFVTHWAKEKQQRNKGRRDNQVFNYWNILSSSAMKQVAHQCPTTVADLRAMKLLQEPVVLEFGPRIVRCVQMFLEKKELKPFLWPQSAGWIYEVPTTTWSSTNNNVSPHQQPPEWKRVARKGIPSRWPMEATLQLEKILLSQQQEEMGFTNTILSVDQIKSIAFHAPTSTQQLWGLSCMGEPTFQEFGYKIVQQIQQQQQLLQQHYGHEEDREPALPSMGDDQGEDDEVSHMQELYNALSRPLPIPSAPQTDNSPLRNATEEFLVLEETNLSQETKNLSSSGPAGPLSREAITELSLLLKVMSTHWAEEEMILSGRSVYGWDILSPGARGSVATRAPVDMETLKSIPNLKEETIRNYGVRIVAVVQMFLEKRNIIHRSMG